MGGPGWRSRRHQPDRSVGGPRRPHRRSALPRAHRPRPVRGPLAACVRRVGGRSRHPRGTDRGRRDRRLHRPPSRPARGAAARRRRPGPACRPGDRATRQLVQPGAVRSAHRSAMGTGDRPGAPARGLPRRGHIPSHVPVRSAVEPGARRWSRVVGAAPPGGSARSLVRALRRGLRRGTNLGRGAPDRPGCAPVRRALEHMDERHCVLRGRRLAGLRLVAGSQESRGGARCGGHGRRSGRP